MAGILDSLGSMLTPDVVNQISSAIGIDPETFNKGLGAAAPTLLGGLAKSASTPEGASSLLGKLPQDDGGGGDPISNIISSITEGAGGTQSDMLSGLLGPGVNGIANTLSQKLGFNIQPILAIAAPLIINLISKFVKQGNVDATGLSNQLNSEAKAFADDPANKATTDLVTSALEAGDKSAALRSTFTDDEWMKVRLGPAASLYLVAEASPSGGGGQVQELAAAVSAVEEAVRVADPTSLIGTGFGGGMSKEELERLRKDAPPREQILAAIKEATTIVSQKSGADTQAYRDMVLTVAQKAAEAAKEGGFLGFGGKTVTAEEQQAINDIQSAVS